jgi:hypothetical protein
VCGTPSASGFPRQDRRSLSASGYALCVLFDLLFDFMFSGFVVPA